MPGAVTSALSEFPNDLIRDGAALIRDAQDLLDVGLGIGVASVRGVGPALDEALAQALFAVEGVLRRATASRLSWEPTDGTRR